MLLRDRNSLLILLAGLGLCLFHILTTLPTDFDIDLDIHHEYLKFLVVHHQLPDASSGVRGFYHLPAYYILASPFYYYSNALGLDALQSVRLISLIYYAVYLLLVISMLRTFLPLRGKACYLILGLIAFWPVGFINSGRVHPEILSYIGHIGLIYSLLCWIAGRQVDWLANAFFFCGVFLLTRNYAIFFLIELGFFFAYGLYQYRQKLANFFTMRMVSALLFCGACYAFSAWHSSMFPNISPNRPMPPWTFLTLVDTFLYFNPLIFVTETALDPHIGQSLDHHQHYFWRSALLGGFNNFKAWPMVFAATNVWFLMMLYVLTGGWQTWKNLDIREKQVFGLALFFMVMMGGMSMGARYFHPYMPNISDARYVFPFTALFILCYGRVIASYQQQGRAVMVSLGQGLAIGLILLSIAIFVGEALIL